MSTFKVSFNSGTGHDDLDEENNVGKHGKPHILEFDTFAERAAFLRGVYITSEALDGWVDGWVETKIIEDEVVEVEPDEDYKKALKFLFLLAALPSEEIPARLVAGLEDGIQLNSLCQATRAHRSEERIWPVLDVLKRKLLEDM